MAKYFTTKQPSEEYSVSFDFADVLGDTEEIASASITAVDQTTLENVSTTILDSTQQAETPSVVYAWVQGGESGHNYLLTCQIVGDAGSVYELEAVLPVLEITASTAGFDIDAFRENFPEFASRTKYPDAVVTFWSGIGTKLLNEIRWGDLLTHGLSLYTAHSLVIAKANSGSETAGGDAGFGYGEGLISSKGVGGVNVSYNIQEVAIDGAGEYNSTTYGRQFIKLAKIVGSGGLQVLSQTDY